MTKITNEQKAAALDNLHSMNDPFLELSHESYETIESTLQPAPDLEALKKKEIFSYDMTPTEIGKVLGWNAAIDAVSNLLNLSDRDKGKTYTIPHDGFTGEVIGHYTTREGKKGVVMQQIGTRVVHVYGEKWLSDAAPDIAEGE